MALYAGPPPCGRETRTVWTYADGTKVCPSDTNLRARLFTKMLKNLDRQDLALLDALLGAKRIEFLSADIAQRARIAELEAIARDGLSAVEARDRPGVEGAEARLAEWASEASKTVD